MNKPICLTHAVLCEGIHVELRVNYGQTISYEVVNVIQGVDGKKASFETYQAANEFYQETKNLLVV